jgi:Homeodomain-like domain
MERVSRTSNLDIEDMTTIRAIDTKDRATLAKVRALFESPVPGEVSAAQGRATTILNKYGRTLGEIDLVLAEPDKAPPTVDLFDMMAAASPGMAAWMKGNLEKLARKRADLRARVVTKYGGEEAARQPVPMEQAIEDAAAPFKRRQPKTFANGVFETDTLDGWANMNGEKVPDHVRRAIESAIPVPTSIREAKAEYDFWRERNDELEAVCSGDGGDTYLSLECALRQTIICDLLETGLRAQTMADVLVRQRYLVTCECDLAEVEQAVMADLEHLAAMAEWATKPAVQTGQWKTASTRRAEVVRLLSNVDTARLSDREIARMVGVSPQTVGNIRRKHEASARA